MASPVDSVREKSTQTQDVCEQWMYDAKIVVNVEPHYTRVLVMNISIFGFRQLAVGS